jgi:hypothetical protein
MGIEEKGSGENEEQVSNWESPGTWCVLNKRKKASGAQKNQEKGVARHHRAAVHGFVAPSGENIRGGIMAHALGTLRRKLLPALYVAAVGVAMIGWAWMILGGLEWALGA